MDRFRDLAEILKDGVEAEKQRWSRWDASCAYSQKNFG